MCGCLGLTSDIRVKAWKGKSIYRQTSEGEASPAQVGPREPGLQLHNLLICQIWMEQTARTARLKQVHCWLRYTHRFTSESANSSAASPEVWVDWGGVSTGSHKGLYVGTSKPRESADQQPVNRFMVLAIFPCALIVMDMTGFIQRDMRRMTGNANSLWQQRLVQSGYNLMLRWATWHK